MRILEVELVGYLSFVLGNINYFKYTPDQFYNVILGTNGSGKSSLLRALCPVPMSDKRFNKKGYRSLKFEHRGHLYIVTENFKEGKTYSFIKDGVELNHGRLVSAQLALCVSELNLTEDVFSVLAANDGNARFTQMNPQERRSWFMRLSPVNFDYALKTYNDLQNRSKEAIGAYKYNNTKLVEATKQMLDPAELEELKMLSTQLCEEINILFKNITPLDFEYDLQELSNSIQRQLTELEATSKGLLGVKFDTLERLSLAALENDLRETQTQLAIENSEYRSISDRLVEYDALVRKQLEAGITDVVNVDEQLASKAGELAELVNVPVKFVLTGDFRDINLETYSATDTFGLHHVLLDIPENPGNVYSVSGHNNRKEKLLELSNKLGGEENRLSVASHRLDDLTSLEENVCPKCSFTWRKGDTQARIQEYTEKKAFHQKNIDNLKTEIAELEDLITRESKWVAAIGELRNVARATPRLKPLWDAIGELEVGQVGGSAAINLLGEWQHSVDIYSKCCLIQESIEDLKRILDIQRTVSGEGVISIKEETHRLESLLETKTRNIALLKDSELVLSNQIKAAKKIGELGLRIDESAKKLEKDLGWYITTLHNTEINKVIKADQLRLANITSKLNDAISVSSVIESLKQSTTELKGDIACYKALIDAMSPHGGLIAKNTIQLMHAIQEQMNDVIGSIWTYDLKVGLPRLPEKGKNMDYKFPLTYRDPRLPGQGGEVPDVSLGSSAQKDIVDFAFKLVVMCYLDMLDWPMFLDELGASFDEEHRYRILTYIKQLVLSQQCSQVFYISHYASSHAAMSTADITVLDSSNVTVPRVINQNVIIK